MYLTLIYLICRVFVHSISGGICHFRQSEEMTLYPDIYIVLYKPLFLLTALPYSQVIDCLEADVGETWP